MAYLGNKPVNNFVSFAKQDITGNGGTSYSLDYPVTGANDIDLFINNVRQEPTEAYSCSGSTLTLTGAVSSTDDIYVIFRGRALQTAQHPSDSALEAASANINSGTLYVDPVNSRVGIGTVAPDYALHLKGSFPYIAFEDTDNGATSKHTITGNSDGNVYFDSVINSSSGNSGFHFRQNGAAKTSLTIDASGRVTMPYQPAFLAHGNNSNYIPISDVGAGYYVPFANAVTNIGNHYNSSTYKFTAPVAGMYHFHSAVYTRTGTISEDIYTRWRVNNSSNKGYAYFYNTTGSEIHHTLTDSIDIYLNASDYIGVTINGSANADMYTGFQECRFSGYLIG